MEYRHLGTSGLKISELTYGNWITHGSQVEEEAARRCVAAALGEGITSFDTADVYAGTRAEEVLGRALSGVRRAGGALGQLAGRRLIGPYSVRSSSSSVTWSTPASSRPRQFSPSQLSASPWLAKMASGRSPDETTAPSGFS